MAVSTAQPIPIASSSKLTQDSLATPRSVLASYINGASPRTYVPHGSLGQRFSLGISPGVLGCVAC